MIQKSTTYFNQKFQTSNISCLYVFDFRKMEIISSLPSEVLRLGCPVMIYKTTSDNFLINSDKMGYNYFCLVTIEEGEPLSWEKDIPKMRVLYKKLRKEDDHFPKIGQVTRGWYSCGDDGTIALSFVNFTKEFPGTTFRLHLSYFDHEGLDTWLIKGEEVLGKTGMGFADKEVVDALGALFGFSMKSFAFEIDAYSPAGDITGALNPKYGYDVDQEFFYSESD